MDSCYLLQDFGECTGRPRERVGKSETKTEREEVEYDTRSYVSLVEGH